jgi:hypothetical protein
MVWVFKTSVTSDYQVKWLCSILDSHIGQNNWNFDPDDCDRILRLASLDSNNVFALIRHLNSIGIEITELK